MKIYEGPGGDGGSKEKGEQGAKSRILKLEAGIVAESLMCFLGFLFARANYKANCNELCSNCD